MTPNKVTPLSDNTRSLHLYAHHQGNPGTHAPSNRFRVTELKYTTDLLRKT